MDYRETIRVDAAGTPGNHGSSSGDYISKTSEAGLASDGSHGESATRPSPGTSARDIQVRLYYNENDPAIVQVAGEGAWAGKAFAAARDQIVYLDCKGGDGGRGGRGQDGQPGGIGLRGRDATKYRDGEPGGTGGRGGDGGYGTNGADGGNGGNVLISVGEDDLDLLIACTWDTSGGKGGVSGQHGMPGDGGIGGEGGGPHYWTERVGDHTYHHSRPAGRAGNQGHPGNQPSTYLSGGKNGREGSTQIRLLRKDLTEATYPSRYELEVVGFDVLDENGDGVNEPGEHLIVQNIKVKNKGQMPSPAATNPITVLIHGTRWLESVESEPVFIPPSIAPGDEVIIPGKVRAYIRNESSPRAPGEPLRVQDEVSLIATFSHRLNRTLPGFSGSTKYLISYPLELTPPKCLESVQKGDRVRFSWTLRNVSRKVQGYATTPSRYTATRFSDPAEVFELPYSDTEVGNAHEAIDLLDELQPGEEVPIEQDFIVSMSALEYSDAQLQLELLLGDSHRAGDDGQPVVRSIMTYNMHLQVASVYKYDPASRYLLIVNSKTPNWAIHQIIGFIRSELRLGLDIYNISLTGSLKNSANQGYVLNNYRGKSIIIYGNAFPYFDKGLRTPWQLMDSWEVNALARSGSSFLFCGVSDEINLKQWASHITSSGHFNEKEAHAVGDLAAVVSGSAASFSNHGALEGAPYVFTSAQSCSDKLGGCFTSTSPYVHAQRAAGKIDKLAPLQRFMIVSNEHDLNEDTPTLLAVEGFPKTATLSCSTLVPAYNTESSLSDHLRYAIIGTLPFVDLARIFWNSWTATVPDAEGTAWYPMTTAYAGLDWHQTQGLTWEGRMLQTKIISFVCLAIESKVGVEIAHFLSGNAPGKDCLKRLPKLDHLLSIPEKTNLQITIKPDTLMLKTLGTILGALLNIGLTEFFSNVIFATSIKRKLHDQVSHKLNDAIKKTCAPDNSVTIQKSIVDEAQKTKKEIKSAGGAHDLGAVLLARQAILTQVNSALSNLAALNPNSIAVTTARLGQMRAEHDNRAMSRDMDEKHAARVIAMHVNPDLDADE